LQLVSVIINYVTTGSVDGVRWVVVTPDKYPASGPDEGYGVLMQTLDLEGSQVTNVRSTIDVEPIVVFPNDSHVIPGQASDLSQRAWWVDPRGGGKVEFSDTNLNPTNEFLFWDWTCTDEDGATVNTTAYPNRVVKGSVLPWMRLDNGSLMSSKRATIKVKVRYLQKRYVSPTSAVLADSYTCPEESWTCNVMLTDGEAGEYNTVAEWTEGETIPTGVAQTLWNQFLTLQWEGEHVKVEDAVNASGSPVGLNNMVNLWNDAINFPTMNAIVRTVTEDEGSGRVSVSFGPPRHLGARELCDLQLFGRQRRVWKNPSTRETGQSSDGGGDIEL
jgi:hypothetical protein